MTTFEELIAELNRHLPPAPLRIIKALSETDIANSANDRELILDFAVRLEADCICGNDAPPQDRALFKTAMAKIIEQIDTIAQSGTLGSEGANGIVRLREFHSGINA